MLLPGEIFKLKIHQNVFADRALPMDPTGGACSTPQTPFMVFRGCFVAGEGRGGKGGERREREGEHSRTSFFTI